MRTDHAGFDAPTETSPLFRAMLPMMARLKIAKTVPERETILRRALAATTFEDRHWPEILVSRLTEAGVKEASDAHLMALMALRAADPVGLSRIASEIDPDHPLLKAFINGMSAAAPEFIEQVRNRRIDSDHISVRCWLMHIFRRETNNVFQVFLVDAAVRKFHRATGMTVLDLVREVQSRIEDHPAPSSAWGYAIFIIGLNAFTGLYLPKPGPEIDDMLARLLPTLKSQLGPDRMRIVNALAAAGATVAFDGKGAAGMVPFLQAIAVYHEMPYFAVYGREDEGGTITQVIPIEATSVEEARRKARRMPALYLQDMFRQGMELSGMNEPDPPETKI